MPPIFFKGIKLDDKMYKDFHDNALFGSVEANENNNWCDVYNGYLVFRWFQI